MIQDKAKINIQVLSYIHAGGEWISTLQLIKATKKIRPQYKFYLIGFKSGPINSEPIFVKKKYFSYSIAKPPFSFFKKLLSDCQNARSAIKKELDRGLTFDIFLVTEFLFVPVLFTLGQLNNRKIIYYFHGIRSLPIMKISDIDYRQIVIKFVEFLALTLSDVIIVPSQSAKSYIKEKLGLISLFKKTAVIPNFTDSIYSRNPSKRSILKLRKDLGIPINNKVILYSGRINVIKGIDNLIDAFATVKKKLKNISLVIVYPKSSADEKILGQLKDQVESLGLKNKVIFFTVTKKISLSRIYRISDVLVLASKIEMAPLVILEALMCKTPCIGTPVGNIPEILSLIEPRLLLKDNSAGELAKKLLYFFNIPKRKAKKIKEKGYKIAKSYTANSSSKKFINLLETLTE